MDDKDTKYRGSDAVAEGAAEAAPPEAPIGEDLPRGDGLATGAGMKDPPDDVGADGPRGDGLADDA